MIFFVIQPNNLKASSLSVYVDSLIEYLFELVTSIVILRIYHLRSTDRIDRASEIVAGFNEDLYGRSAALTPNREMQLLVAQCLKIVPLSEATIWQLRQVSFTDRKNAYRRLRDAIETMNDIQLLLLALAYEDDLYEQFFALDLNPSSDATTGQE